MAITLQQSLEGEMAAALARGNEVRFVAARNKRQAYWDYRDGVIDLATAKYRLRKGTTSEECRAWDGALETEEVE